jgi:PAS domain S-box-containing protein
MPDYTKDEICYLLDRNKSWQGNFLIQTKNKGQTWFNSNIFPVNNEEGLFIGYTFLATIEKPQQDLISSQDTTESWMKAIFNDPEQGNVLIGLLGEVIDFNAKAFHFMEWYSLKILETDNSISDYFNEKFSKTFLALFDKVKHGQRQKFIRSFKNASGYDKVVEIELRPVISQKNEIMGVIMVIIDISADVALENRIKLSEKKLEEIAFINAHELRAPLASILGLVNLLNFEQVDGHSKMILSHLKKASTDLEYVIHKVSENTYLDRNDKDK